MPADAPLLNRLLDRRDAWRRKILRHRGILAAALMALAAYLLVHALTAPPPPTQRVWVAAHDLPSGTTLSRADLEVRSYARGTAPDAILTDPDTAEGRILATPVHTGMPLASDGFVGQRWLDGYPGLSAVPIRITDPAVVPLLTVGARVDLIASDPDHEGRAQALADDAVVLALPPTGDRDATSLDGRLVVVGVEPDEVDAVGTAGVSRYLTVVWRQPTGG